MKFKFLLSIALITTLVACGGAEERKAVYMEKAKASIEAGDLDKARIELKNVLQIDPKDGEAFFQLGSVFEQQKDYRKAYGYYLKAEELAPKLWENHARLGRFYLLLMNDAAKAQEKIDLLLANDPASTDGLLLKAAVLTRQGNNKQAMDIVKSILAKDPNHIESIAFLSSLYGREDNLEAAIELLDTSLKNNKNNEKLSSLLAVALISNKEYERAEVIYKDFLTRNPDNKAGYDNLAAFYNQSGNKVKAEEILRASVENNVNDVERQLTLVKYIKLTKSNSAAIDELKKLIARQKGIGKLRIALIELHLIDNDKKSAIEVCNRAITDFSDEETGIDARIALTSIYISDKDYDKARDVIEAAILISPNNPEVNFIRAKLALNDKDMEKAIISLRIVIKEKPENVDAYFLLANVYQLQKNNEQVTSILNTAYGNNKTNADSLLKLAKYQLSRDIDKASKIIDDYNSIRENDYDGLSIKGAILNQDKNQAEAFKIGEKLMELYPERPNGYLQVVPYYVQKQSKQEAIAVLEKGYLNAKENRKILILLSNLQVSDKRFDTVAERIKTELSASPDDAELKLLLAKVYILDNKMSMAEELLNQAREINTGLEEPYLLLAQIHEMNKDSKAVKSILVKGAANVPTSTTIPLKLASLYEQDGDFNDAIDIFYKLNQLNPDNLVVVNNLASLLSDHGAGDTGLEMAKSLVHKLEGSNHPSFLDTVGWVYYKLGNAEKAIHSLKQVVEKRPDVNVFNYHLGMAYKLSGDKAQAKIYLEKSLADKKDFLQKALAEDALKSL